MPRHMMLSVRPGISSFLALAILGTLLAGSATAQSCETYLARSRSNPSTFRGDYSPVKAGVEHERLCVRSFPWPERLEDLDSPLEGAVSGDFLELRRMMRTMRGQATGRDPAMSDERRFQKAMEEYPSSWMRQKYYFRLLQGANPVQAELFAAYFHVRKLHEEGRFDKAREVLAELRGDPFFGAAWRAEPEAMGRLDEGDQHTFLRIETLIGLLRIYDLDVRLQAVDAESPASLVLLAEIEALPVAALDSFSPAEQTRRAIRQDARRAAEELSERPAWGLGDLDEGILGRTISGGRMDVYVDPMDGRGPRILRAVEGRDRLMVLAGEKVLEEFRRHNREILRRKTNGDRRMAVLLETEGGYVIEMADRSVKIEAAEVDRLRRGLTLPDSHELGGLIESDDRPLVIYSHPLMQRPGERLRQVEELGFLLQAAYPHAQIYRDDFTEETARRIDQLSRLSIESLEDLVVLVEDGSFGVDDKNLMADIKDDLRAEGVRVLDYQPGLSAAEDPARAVVVITGHIDQNLASFVRHLGEMGWLRGKYVLFNSCYQELSSQLVAEINSHYGAVATYRHEGRIRPDRVGDVLFDLVEEIRRERPDPDFGKVLNRANIRHQLRGMWVICRKETGGESWPS